MREFKIDLLKCKLNQISPDEYVLLYLLFYKDFKEIEKLYGRKRALEIRNRLLETKYIISNKDVLFKNTILSSNIRKLLNIRNDIINFLEWYNEYPHKVGDRILRAVNIESKEAKKHEKKYLSMVKTLDLHNEICQRTREFVKMKRNANKLEYLPQIDRVLNNREWENWINLGNTNLSWNQTSI